ncbi:MAG: GNAT family N-acetyltransferase [Ignavibacteria bacterium]|nr:GNAT family N-acetyltransferase [Ignavibacteria bacterium]MBT8383635.1 GNAT family N-acetyltransferase [Ignavibacteria bacterium]NNJ53772.1 GNAT family N-acetyltransferase [Ignavibacteriaceae bacterium]NNL21281.1 GNAT family N-acetyltransferase [Ignavibacteriaceae bacterium]
MLQINKLPEEKWDDFKSLRLEALQKDPLAFGSSYTEEIEFTEDIWKNRLQNTLFAIQENKLIGMVSFLVNQKSKLNHTAEIYGVYVKYEFRNKKIGKQLIETAINLIRQNRTIKKIKLVVSAIQESAVNLYIQLGFEIVGTLKNELKVDDNFYDALVMEKIF